MSAIDWSQYKEEPDVDWSEFKEEPSGNHWQNLYKGFSEGYPHALKSGANAVGEIFGAHPFDQQEQQPTKSWQESLGRGAGEVGGYLSLGVPAAAGITALLPEVVPGLLGASIGSAVAGAGLKSGGWKERALAGLESSIIPAAGKATGLAGRLGKSYFTGATPRKAADIIQGAYDPLRKGLSESFESIGNAAEKIGINKISIKKDLLDKIKEVGPKTDKFKRFVDKAEHGDYRALRSIQTELGKRAERHMSSGLGSEYDVGELMMEARNDINREVANHFEEKGFKNLADKLKRNVAGWKDMLETYHSNPTIGRLVGKNREVPKNLVSTLGKDQVDMAKLRAAHPEIEKLVRIKKDKDTVNKLSKGLLYRLIGAEAGKALLPSDH